MAKKGVQTAARLKGGFIANPGVSQSRKMVPMISGKQAKAANALLNLAKQHGPTVVQRLAPIVLANAPETYRWVNDNMKRMPDSSGYNNNYTKGLDVVVKNIGDRITKAFKGSSGTVGSDGGSYGLSKAPNPRKVMLNSGIVPNTFTQDSMNALEGVCSPMHISGCTLQIPTNAAQPLNGYFLNTIAFDIQTRAQANVGFDLLAGSNFSALNIQTAMNGVISCLQYYYWFTSILSYESDTTNKNEAMYALRGTISSGQLNLITQLGRRLEDTPIPPRLVEWVKYMSANYYSGDSQGAAIIKTCPNMQLLSGTDANTQTILSNCLATLSNTTNNQVFTLMRRAIPQWRCGTLYDVTPIPNYDSNFKTIFSNLPSCYYNVSAMFSPLVSTDLAPITYNSFTNKLDGVAYACTGLYNSTTAVSQPGLVSSVPTALGVGAAITSSRYSWYRVGVTTTWYPSDGSAFLTASRQDSTQYSTIGTAVTPHIYGTDKCQNVNATSLVQSAENTLDFLFNINSINTGRVGKLNSFNRKANGNI